MNATRLRYAAQDRIIAAIAYMAANAPDLEPDMVAAIRTEGAKLAAKWGVKHADLPDTRRSAGQ